MNAGVYPLLYESSCIGQSRYCRVACIDGQIAGGGGVIMGRCGRGIGVLHFKETVPGDFLTPGAV